MLLQNVFGFVIVRNEISWWVIINVVTFEPIPKNPQISGHNFWQNLNLDRKFDWKWIRPRFRLQDTGNFGSECEVPWQKSSQRHAPRRRKKDHTTVNLGIGSGNKLWYFIRVILSLLNCHNIFYEINAKKIRKTRDEFSAALSLFHGLCSYLYSRWAIWLKEIFGKIHDLLISRHTQVDTTILKTHPSRVRSVSNFQRG